MAEAHTGNSPALRLYRNSAFGKAFCRIPISANKFMLGHPIEATGAIEWMISVLTIEKNIIPPTINYQ